MEITVKLYGDLRKYGTEFKLKNVVDSAEALRALYAQIDGFRIAIQRGIFKVRVGSKYFTMETLKEDVFEPLTDGAILHIAPVLAGSGGAVQTIIGAVLVVVGVVTSWAGGGYLIAAGVALMASGVAQMLTPTPQAENPNRNETEKQQSTSFSNLQNLVAQGRPIPLAYGRIMTGSLIIGKGVETIKVELIEPQANVDRKKGFRGLKRRK